MLKHRWIIYATSALAIYCAIATFQPVRAEDTIATASSIRHAPYSKVFYTGAIYAVRDHDYQGSEPKIGVSTLWSKNPADGSLALSVRYCVHGDALATASLSKLVLLNNNQPLVTIAQPIETTPTYQRVVQDGTDIPEVGFWDPEAYWGDDFWDGIDEPFWADATIAPPVVCTAGSSRFNIAPLASAIAQLPAQTLQMNLIFSNGTTSEWKLGQKTVQALKELLAIRRTSQNTSQAPSQE